MTQASPLRKMSPTSPSSVDLIQGLSEVQCKLNILYLAFFILHIPVMLLIDLPPLYPASITPRFLCDLRQWYIATYDDLLFSHPPAWFRVYLVMEAGYHLPLSCWAVRALSGSNGKVSSAKKLSLAQLYVPYLLFSVLMGVDMFLRVKRRLEAFSS